MKLICYSILLSMIFSSCERSEIIPERTTAVLYETAEQKDALPVLAAIDLQSDPQNARKYLAESNYLKENSNDTLRVTVNTYLNGVCKNSLFRLFEPNIEHPAGEGTTVYKLSPVLGRSLVSDTLKVDGILVDSPVNKFGMSFLWVPSTRTEARYSFIGDGSKTADLLALNPDGISLHMTGLNITEVNTEAALLKQWVNAFRGNTHHKHIINLDFEDVKNIRLHLEDDTTILLKYAFHGRDYYYTGTVDQITDGVTVLVD